MIHPLDALTLARTKLRSHRVRTAITIVIAGLFFGLIIASLFFIEGIFASVDKYSSVGLNNRILVSVYPSPAMGAPDAYSLQTDQDFIREVEAAHASYVAKKKEAAKKYSVPYDAAVEDPSPIVVDPVTKQKAVAMESMQSSAVNQALEARRASTTKPFEISEYVKKYKTATLRGTTDHLQPADGRFMLMKDGKEVQPDMNEPSRFSMMRDEVGGSLSILDGSVAKPFITNNSFDPQKGEIPVIIPFSHAEKMLGLEKLSNEAASEERRERLRYVRENIGNITASYCYRNNASQALLSQAIMQHDMIKRQSGEEGFTMPALLYDEPNTTDCVGVTIKSDTRSAAEKQADENRKLFEQEIGTWPGEPMERKVVVRGVGVSGDYDQSSATFSPVTLVLSLLNSNLGYGTWSIPSDLFEQLPESARPAEIFREHTETDRLKDPYSFASHNYLVEFTDKEEARDLINNSNTFDSNGSGVPAYPFGSGVLFIDDLRGWIETALFWALIVVGSFATFTLWAVIGRTLADSRRESAVFRAIGATRLDIASIYGLYALLLSLRVALFALLLGLAISLPIDVIYKDRMTVGAEVAYATSDTGIEFHLFGLSSGYVAIVLGAVVLAGLLASIVPILLSVRRNPITDMRDDG